MSLARTQLQSRLIKASSASARLSTSYSRQFSISAQRFEAPSDAKSTDLSTKERSAELVPRHQPDYNATIDHGTSSFSPVPRRVMDGSEPGDITAAAVLSGAPVDLQARTVRIYRPTKPATQSGTWHGHNWRMDWDILQKGHRWENPLMGWQSSADGMQGTHINFRSKEEAIKFAEKQGYEYFVQEPNQRRVVPKSYANNFIYDKGIESKSKDALGTNKIKHIKTK